MPLEGPFHSQLNRGLWSQVAAPIALRSIDFRGAPGVTLHAYLCPADLIPDLTTWGESRHWFVGSERVQLVVLAESLAQ